MGKLMEFATENGAVVVIEVADRVEQEGRVPAGAAHTALERAGRTLENTLENLRPFALATLASFQKVTENVTEVSVEFGIGFTASAGAFIASVDTEATVKVTLSWKRSDQ